MASAGASGKQDDSKNGNQFVTQASLQTEWKSKVAKLRETQRDLYDEKLVEAKVVRFFCF